jgi:Glyoxalase-like domain
VTDQGATPPTAPLAVGWVAVDCADPSALAGWWAGLLGGEPTVDADGDVLLDIGPVPLLFMRVPEAKAVKNRLHLDLRVADYDDAVARAVALGATPTDDFYVGERWRVLRDPEGNEFCIIRPKAEG